MVISIVPLAGPDLIERNGTIKSLKVFKGKPQLEVILKSRSWHNDANKYIFVMQNNYHCKLLYENYISEWFKEAKSIYLEDVVNGALMSCIGGICFVENFSEPVIIDLGDIFYESKICIDVREYFAGDFKAYVPCFNSQKEKYSYIEINNGRLKQVKEKKVISSNATCGVYAFKNVKELLKALAWYTDNAEFYRVNNLDYIAPILNYYSDTLSLNIEECVNIMDPN